MKQRKEESDVSESKTKEVVPRPPPPPPKFRVLSRQRAEESVTKQEIAQFWRQKRIEEEDHLLAAIKTAARLRARNLTTNGIPEQEYQSFELSLNTDGDEDETKEEKAKSVAGENDSKKEKNEREVPVGIKDWLVYDLFQMIIEYAILEIL